MDNITLERIKEVMGNMTQAEFAGSIHSSQPVISKIMNGEQPSINVLVEISKKYKVSVDWLLGLSSQKNLAGYMSYKEKMSTYADVISVLVKLIQNKNCEFIRDKEDSDGLDYLQRTGTYSDRIEINDHFIGDVLSSVSSLINTNPETVDRWISNICEDYNIPLIRWSESVEAIYQNEKPFLSSLEILKQIYENKEC